MRTDERPQARYPPSCDGDGGGTGKNPGTHGRGRYHQRRGYVRKMALNGYILHVDLSPVKELVSLQRRCANNLNQVAVHANMYGVYPEEIAGSSVIMKRCGGRFPMYSKSFPSWWQSNRRGGGHGQLWPAALSFFELRATMPEVPNSRQKATLIYWR